MAPGGAWLNHRLGSGPARFGDDTPPGAVRAHVSRSGRSLALGICPWRVLHAHIGSYGPQGPAEACVISARSRSEVMTLDRDRAEVNFSNTGVSTQSEKVCACKSPQLGVRSARICADSVREAHTATSTVRDALRKGTWKPASGQAEHTRLIRRAEVWRPFCTSGQPIWRVLWC